MSANGVSGILSEPGEGLGIQTAGCVADACGVAMKVGVEEGVGKVGAAATVGAALSMAVAVARAVGAGVAVAIGGESWTTGLADGWAEPQPTSAMSDAPTKSRRANVRADSLTNSPLGCSLRSDAAAEPIVTWLLEFNAPHADVRPDDRPAHR